MDSFSDGETQSELRRKLALLKGASPSSARKGDPAPRSADQAVRFQLIDCRPNLFECLARAGADISFWRRSLLVLRLWFDRIAVHQRRSPPDLNDNHP